jgi:hypothetical protein
MFKLPTMLKSAALSMYKESHENVILGIKVQAIVPLGLPMTKTEFCPFIMRFESMPKDTLFLMLYLQLLAANELGEVPLPSVFVPHEASLLILPLGLL